MDNNPIIYHDPQAHLRSPGKGEILIASPFMQEDFFARAVVLLLDNPADGGRLGLVLNRKAKVTLQDIFPPLAVLPPVEVFCGGPVGLDRLFMLHSRPDVFGGSTEVAPGVYVGGDPDSIVDYLLDGGDINGCVRFLVGYSGWGAGQLKSELQSHYWAVSRPLPDMDLLYGKGGAYWRRVVSLLGPEYNGWLNVPLDPSMN